MNKKGNIFAIMLIVGALFILLFLGLTMIIGGSVVNWVFDEAVPELTTIGMVDQTNVSHAVTLAITPVNTVVQNFQWVAALIYILGIGAVFGLAFTFKNTGNKWLIGLFFMMMLLLVFTCIFISNIYEDFYNDSGELADRLHEYTILSYLILYSPAIIGLVGFIAGIILFSGVEEFA